jgi:hypothetical protein
LLDPRGWIEIDGAAWLNTRFGLIFRNWVASLLNVRPIADLALSRELKDRSSFLTIRRRSAQLRMSRH